MVMSSRIAIPSAGPAPGRSRAGGRFVLPPRTPPLDSNALLLSAREQEIAELVAQGLSNKEIGQRLGISHWTVSTHLRRVFAKLDINGRVDLCRMVTSCWGAGR